MSGEGRRQALGLVKGVTSQGLSAVGNFALVVVVARTSTAEGFGAFAVAYSIAMLLTLSTRGAIGETLAVTTASPADGKAALGASILIGLTLSGMFLVAAGATLATPVGPWLLHFSLALPCIIVQDAARHVGFVSRRAGIAAMSDAVWLVAQLSGWAVLHAISKVSPHTLFAIWWGSAAIAFLVIVPWTGLPSISSGVRWLRANGRVGRAFAAEWLLGSGASQAAVYAVGIVAGLPAAGALRGAQSLLGPARSAGSGVEAIALPEGVGRLHVDGEAALRQYALRVATSLVVFGLVVTTVLWQLPDSIGRALLGETWDEASRVILPVGIALLGGLALTGIRVVMRAQKSTHQVLQLRVGATMLTIGLGVSGAAVASLQGAAYGLAVAQVLTTGLGWWLTRRPVG